MPLASVPPPMLIGEIELLPLYAPLSLFLHKRCHCYRLLVCPVVLPLTWHHCDPVSSQSTLSSLSRCQRLLSPFGRIWLESTLDPVE